MRINDKIKKNALISTFLIAILIIILVKTRFYHTESIISVYKFLNNDFLSNDFFVESLLNFHSQYYFVMLVGILSKIFFSRPELILSFLGMFSKVFTLYAIYIFGRDFSKNRSEIRGLLLAIMSTVTIVSLGGWSLLLDFSRPWSFVHPMIILGILYSLKKEIKKSMLFFGIASIFHPLLGGVMGGISFGASYISNLIESKKKIFEKIFEKKYLYSILIFFSLFLFNLVPAIKSISNYKLPTSQFVHILANYAHPVHYIPSTWGIKPFIDLSLIIISFVIIFSMLKDKSWLDLNLKIFSGFIISLMIFGYLFVEIIPTRLFASIIGFRYFIFLYLIIIFSFSLFIEENLHGKRINYLLFLIGFIISYFLLQEAYVILFCCVTIYLCSKFSSKFKYLFFAIPLVSILFIDFNFVFYAIVSLVAFLPLIFNSKYNNLFIKISKIIIIILCLLILYLSSTAESRYVNQNFDQYDISLKLNSLTSENSIIVAPIRFGMIRTIGERALFVGSEFPFLDETMDEWYDRAKLVWGDNLTNEEIFYKNIDDDKLNYLEKKYNVTHAVLFLETKSNFDEIYRNDKFKIIEI